jgi:DMSO/TMAO reductase YedYZ molybdopterin-dependent catalytic subunit
VDVAFDDSGGLDRVIERRLFLRTAAAGTLVAVLGGGTYALAAPDDPRGRELRPDGRPRLPPGQRILDALKPMGGEPGDPSPAAFRLRVYGEVEQPLELDFAALLALPQVEQRCDVHCVTGWTMLDSAWTGVPVARLAELARPTSAARYVIFEAAQGYTSNVSVADALAPNVLVAHRFFGNPLPRPHGPPARVIVPDLYFWKSAKWLQGIRFARADRPGYWEMRGYHNHADPWKEERNG